MTPSKPANDTGPLHKVHDQPLTPEELNLHGSIFCELFDSAGDAESIIMLLKLMVEIGDERDLPLLEFYADHTDARIRETAQSLLRATCTP